MAEDLYTHVYVELARATERHGSIAPPLVDDMDLTTVAALLGTGDTDTASDAGTVATVAQMTGPPPTGPVMRPKEKPQAATG